MFVLFLFMGTFYFYFFGVFFGCRTGFVYGNEECEVAKKIKKNTPKFVTIIKPLKKATTTI